jgi:hypothetical protein
LLVGLLTAACRVVRKLMVATGNDAGRQRVTVMAVCGEKKRRREELTIGLHDGGGGDRRKCYAEDDTPQNTPLTLVASLKHPLS